MTPAPQVSVAAITNLGLVRPHNEDTIAVDRWYGNSSMTRPHQAVHRLDRPLILLIADGMGGHAAGEEASWIATQYLADHLLSKETEAEVAECIRGANRAVHEAMKLSPDRQGMGTTLVGMLLRPGGHIHFNIGDSRLYRHKGGFLRQLSVDDARSSRTSSSDTRRGSVVLTQCLGGTSVASEINPHVGSEPFVIGWRYLLCSDGLTDMVPMDKIEAAMSSEDAGVATSLLASALAAGGEDNISIIVTTVREAP